jgi:hypothetical protein
MLLNSLLFLFLLVSLPPFLLYLILFLGFHLLNFAYPGLDELLFVNWDPASFKVRLVLVDFVKHVLHLKEGDAFEALLNLIRKVHSPVIFDSLALIAASEEGGARVVRFFQTSRLP